MKGFMLVCGRKDCTGVVPRKGWKAQSWPGQVLLPPKEGEADDVLSAYIVPVRQALLDDSTGHVNVVACERDYRSLEHGIEDLPPPTQ